MSWGRSIAFSPSRHMARPGHVLGAVCVFAPGWPLCPPVTIVNAEIDPLLDDGRMLEEALRKAGVSVERKVYFGATHEFFGMAAVVQDAKEAQQWAAERLRRSLRTPSRSTGAGR